jgi:hypothetical protein
MNIFPYLINKKWCVEIIKSLFENKPITYSYKKLDKYDKELKSMLSDEIEIELGLSEIFIDLLENDVAPIEVDCFNEDNESNYIFYFDTKGNFIEYEED